MSSVVFGSLLALVYNIQTSGKNSIIVMVAIIILGVFGYILSKILKPLLGELEKL